MSPVNYQVGFGNHFTTEAIKGTLPQGQNSPQQVAHGLYAEQISGSSFTRPRADNCRTWFYRTLPSVVHGDFTAMKAPKQFHATPATLQPPTQQRWSPLSIPDKATDFLAGWHTLVSNGAADRQQGATIHWYVCNTDMENRFAMNADAEMIIIPQQGALNIRTECGLLHIEPCEIAVIPRGIKWQIAPEGPARGYCCENFGVPMRLPELGPIGSNGLANPRDFLYPLAAYEAVAGDFILVQKYAGQFWQASLTHSPLNVVAWHGNYAPYKYDFSLFNTMNTVSFDHADPSIFTVLTSPSDLPGTANLDLVLFPPRWMVAEHSFRPPYFHRNIMSEFMGLIKGAYDAKEDGFKPGGASCHNCMNAHGPDTTSFTKASEEELKPNRYRNTYAFMLESYWPWQYSDYALATPLRQQDYLQCWQNFTPAQGV